LVLRGEKGSGKGSIGHFLMSIWGRHAFHVSNSSQVTGRFNGHLSDVCFLFADEAFFSGDVKNESVLKALVTEPFLTSEKKGIDAIQVKNYLKLFMTTNKDHAVPASKGDAEYFMALKKEIKDKRCQSTFLYNMLHTELNGWTPRNPPESDGLKDQRVASLDSAGRWLVDFLITDNFNLGINEDEASHSLLDSYHEWCNKNKIIGYDIITAKRLGMYLTKVFGASDYKRGSYYFFGSREYAIKKLEDYEKITI
jgi:hypothetical protein